MKNFFIKTLGCKTNQIEGQLISQNMLENGFEKSPTVTDADIYILNSCAVTHHAEAQANYLLGQAKRLNPNIKTILCGCMPQTNKDDIKNADIILGNTEKLNIVDYLNKSSVNDIFNEDKFSFHILKSSSSTRPSIKIQDGCNNRCAYCIIPYARGKSRSNSIKNILDQINTLKPKEIVLTGIHLGQWGQDFNLKLIDLLKEIEKTDILRYRLGSLYVNEIDDELLNFLLNSKKFCPHFHLSLQSMCDKTLKNMNRFYTVEDVFNLTNKLRFDVPVFIGCDVIVGFPGETEEDFETTYHNLIKAGVNKIHVFPYSKRKGTKAYDMDNQVQENTKTNRAKKLTILSTALYKKFVKSNMDLEHEFIFEKKSIKTGLNCGVTKNYIKAFFKGETDLKGSFKKIKLKDAYKIDF
ncbi:MAG: tRNA (N(6)-L-threonylcarbamoyladenosine(37)-C(2))-methylthiotransferase MtaB [Cyanobacteria bacterium SIG30]|nr:tRNA (N(6)-L-threonylcarbamoyladenosine(37)-C(2))-methylthiotransferase MtaB [Cyanobacteria bacterium SIG30]